MIHKRKDELLRLHVEKRHLSFIAVHKHADARGSKTEGQGRRRLGAEGVVRPVAQTQEPVALSRTHGDLALPVDGAAGHAQVPVRLVPDLHLRDSKVWSMSLQTHTRTRTRTHTYTHTRIKPSYWCEEKYKHRIKVRIKPYRTQSCVLQTSNSQGGRGEGGGEGAQSMPTSQ